jgi:hypothetical protein
MCGKAFENPLDRPELDNVPQEHPAFRGYTFNQLRGMSPEEIASAGFKPISSLPNEDWVYDFLYGIVGEVARPVKWVDEAEKDVVMKLINQIWQEGLLGSYKHLEVIREHARSTAVIFERDRFQAFEDFARNLWRTYKSLTQHAVKAAGLNVGFLWESKEQAFEPALSSFDFIGDPLFDAQFVHILRSLRLNQQELREFRNEVLEHPGAIDAKEKFGHCYDPSWAERTFENISNGCLYLVMFALWKRFPRDLTIAEIPKENRPADYPTRFRVARHPLLHLLPHLRESAANEATSL